MNARRDSSNEPSRGSFGGRALLTAAVVFALAATGVLVLSDELKWLRLGIVAALWAALVGAFLAARYRRQVTDQQDAAADRQERYELELEREVAARREYELEVAAEARRQADEEARDDIAALRQELFGLRQTLESLLGGEFLVERYALRAESTRMRSLPDDRSLKRLPPAKPVEDNVIPSVVQEAQTDLIEPVHQPPKRKVESLPRRAERQNGRPLPEPIKPHPAEVSDRWFVPDGLGTNQQPPATPATDSRTYAARQYVRPDRHASADEPRDRYAKESRESPSRHHTVASGYMEPIARPRGDVPGYTAPSRAESSGYVPENSGYLPPVGRPDPYAAANGSLGAMPPVRRAESSGYAAQPGRAESSGYVAPLSRAESGHGRAEPPGYVSPSSRAESSGYVVPSRAESAHGRAESSGYVAPLSRAESSGYAAQPGRAESSGYVAPLSRAESSGYAAPPNRAESSGYAAQPSRVETSGYGRPGTSGYVVPVNRGEPPARRSRADQPTPDGGGGRRRRAEGQPSWQESRQNEAEPTGSHSAGRSVSELLASHGGGNTPSTPRRRRRRED